MKMILSVVLDSSMVILSSSKVLSSMRWRKGAVALLDELDLANPAKVMCLQSILEGKGYFIKKTGEFIKPKAGFT